MKKIIDKKLLLILVVFFLFYNVLLFFKAILIKHLTPNQVTNSIQTIFFKTIIIETFFSILFTIIIMIITKKMVNKNYKFWKVIISHFFLYITTLALLLLIYDLYLFLFENNSLEQAFKSYLIEAIKYSNTYFLIYFMNVFIIYTYYYVNKVTDVELQKAQLKQQLSNVQVNVLKYQLHPHFFFNTLNTISSLIETDKKLAQDTLADFSDLLRDILFLKDSNLMTLSIELKILKRYLDIMSVRFSDHLIIKTNIEDNLENVLIPSLILQPIVENSIKHGYSYATTELEINISIFSNNENLVIEISNTGERLENKEVKFGTGLKNTEERLKTLYNNLYTFQIKNNDNGIGVKTIIAFPIKRESITKN